jgi:hypothetical protein
MEVSLLKALKEDSETLQNITDEFAPLMSKFSIFFLWEQKKTDLKYTKDYIVEERSAAPIFDNTERCGISATHSGMCKFDDNTSQDFRLVVEAIRRYSQEAPYIISRRLSQTARFLQETRLHEAMEISPSLESSPLFSLMTPNTSRETSEEPYTVHPPRFNEDQQRRVSYHSPDSHILQASIDECPEYCTCHIPRGREDHQHWGHHHPRDVSVSRVSFSRTYEPCAGSIPDQHEDHNQCNPLDLQHLDDNMSRARSIVNQVRGALTFPEVSAGNRRHSARRHRRRN